jgi:hypothetical protein
MSVWSFPGLLGRRSIDAAPGDDRIHQIRENPCRQKLRKDPPAYHVGKWIESVVKVDRFSQRFKPLSHDDPQT